MKQKATLTMPIRVFVISNFSLLRQGIVSLLESLPMQFRVSGTASTLDEATKALSYSDSDIFLVDLGEEQDKTTLLAQSSALHKISQAKILLMGNSLETWRDCISSSEHLHGFISREVEQEELIDALEILHTASTWPENSNFYLKQCNKSRRPRVQIVVPVRLGNEYGESRDFSSKGIYFEIKSCDLEVGSEISFEMDIDLPNGEAILKCKGKVVRKDIDGKVIGLGVEISDSTTCPVQMRLAG